MGGFVFSQTKLCSVEEKTGRNKRKSVRIFEEKLEQNKGVPEREKREEKKGKIKGIKERV